MGLLKKKKKATSSDEYVKSNSINIDPEKGVNKLNDDEFHDV